MVGYLPLALHIARRFSGDDTVPDDLAQVASLCLMGAIDRFDPRRHGDFRAYAVPTIMGEVRRHVRDTTWPRRFHRRLRTP